MGPQTANLQASTRSVIAKRPLARRSVCGAKLAWTCLRSSKEILAPTCTNNFDARGLKERESRRGEREGWWHKRSPNEKRLRCEEVGGLNVGGSGEAARRKNCFENMEL